VNLPAGPAASYRASGDAEPCRACLARSPLLFALECLFEAYWEQATAIVDNGQDAPDAQTRTLVSLLAAGLTDKSIALAMNCSERTIQRRIQQLMTSLGAVTRFQASLMAVRRGWL
jgi:DNA-binding NarL/FixJ family response regulator